MALTEGVGKGEAGVSRGLAAGEALDRGICCSKCDVFVALPAKKTQR